MENFIQALKELKEEKPGLWANIRAKRARGEKPSHGNSNAHKDAVKAGKKINKSESIAKSAEELKSHIEALSKARAQAASKGQTTLLNSYHKEISKAQKQLKKINALSEQAGWPKEHPSRHGDMTFRLQKVMSDRAAYEILDAENDNRVMGRMVFKSPDSLKAFALDYIKPQGGRQTSQF